MSFNEEIHTLLGVAISAFKASEMKGAEMMSALEGKVGSERQAAVTALEMKAKEASEAGEQALHTLATIVLGDLRRIADAMEIIAKSHLPDSLVGK